MNRFHTLAVALISVGILSLPLTGCGRAESPAKTESDVAKAENKGAKNVEQERREAAEDTMAAQKDVNKARAEMTEETAKGDRDVAVAEAEAVHKVSTEKCEAVTGDARSSCKKQADDELDAAKARAKLAERAMTP